jgi:hypothetical protein
VADIFDEVDEDLRAERAQAMFRRYGWLLLAAALMVVGAAAGWRIWRGIEDRADATAAASFLAAMRQASPVSGPATQQGKAAALAGFEKLADSGPEGYRTLARLRAAALKADAGDVSGASALWDAVAGDGGADPALRDLANLLWAQHHVDTGDAATVEARLRALNTPDNPFHSLAAENQALLDLRLGHKDAARAALKQLAQDTAAPDGVRARANSLLSRIGG